MRSRVYCGKRWFAARRVFWSLGWCAALAVACGGGDDSDDNAAEGSAGSAGAEGTRSEAGSSGANTAGGAGSAGLNEGGASGAGAIGGAGDGSNAAGGASDGAGAAGGATGGGATGGNAGAGGGSGKEAVCNYASGLNVAWVKFANDVPNPDLATFKTIFKNTHDAGGRVVRWWFHTNGTVTPGYGGDGKALALQPSHVDGLKAILGAAHDAGVVVNISLWSFDMLQDNAGAAHKNNKALLENDDNRQAYIDRYLTPMVQALKGTPGLYSYEIFNEAEGMAENGWATYRTKEAFIQKTVNWFADAIHAADPDVLVTNGAQTFDYCSGVTGKKNDYSDAALLAAGGKKKGTLDFYEVHYYTSNGISDSVFKHPASYWKLDKKLVIGEFAPADTDGVLKNDLGTYLYEKGYQGGWAWSYDADSPWPAEQGPLTTLEKAHPTVDDCPVGSTQ